MKQHAGIGLVYNEPIPEGLPNWQSSLDVLAQVEAIEASLRQLGYHPVRLPFTRDVGRFVELLRQQEVVAAFNLCESVDDNPQFAAHPAAVLELLDLPFTGSPAAALMTTTDKHLMKLVLRAAGLQTPDAQLYNGQELDFGSLRLPVILKPQFQDASIGIDQESVLADAALLPEAVREWYRRYGPIVVEEYIDGREFNLSLLGSTAPEVMPPAEIDFSGLPGELYKIVGYRAKWEPDSIEYRETKRIFPKLPADVASSMTQTAVACYRLFGLRDYGRVDVRLDGRGTIHILEINANPCLSPDAGFPAALQQAGLDYTGMVQRLVSYLAARL